jgi:hypothetical protein
MDGSDGTVMKTWLFQTRVLTLEQSSRQTGTRTSLCSCRISVNHRHLGGLPSRHRHEENDGTIMSYAIMITVALTPVLSTCVAEVRQGDTYC